MSDGDLGCTFCGRRSFKTRAAEGLADAVEAMLRLRQIDARSLAGDALLDFRNNGIGPTSMVTDRGELLARTAGERDLARKQLDEAHRKLECIAILVSAWKNGDEPEGAPSARRTLLAIADVLRSGK